MKTFTLTTALAIITNLTFAQLPDQDYILDFIDPSITRSASGDINNDGIIDYVGGYYQIHWFEGNGTYEFGTIHNTGAKLNEYLTDLKVVDIDHDGWKDIWYQKGTVPFEMGWLKNPGATDQEWTTYSVAGSYRVCLGIFDMNGDGNEDFVFEDGAYLLGYRELGDGNFSVYHAIPDSWSWVESFSAEDLDGDNDVDLAVYCYDSGVKYWRNNSNGTFTSTNLKNSESSYDVYSGDVNGDNHPDILYNNGSFYVSTFDTITHTFSPGVYNGNMDDFDFRKFLNIDLDLDGDKDFVIVNDNYFAGESTYEISWLESDGSFLNLNVENFESIIAGLPYYNSCMSFNDMNNDGTFDFIQCESGDYGTTAIVSPNIGGFFGAYDSSFLEVSPEVADLIVYDVDGDPDNDLLLAFNNGLLSWFEFNHLVDSFTIMHNINYTGSRPTPENIKKKDIDSDGDFDIISSFSYNGALARTFYHLDLGDGNFETHTLCDTAFSNVWLIDGDEDGDFDLAGLKAGDLNRLLYFTNTGNPDHLFSYTTELTAYGYYNSFVQLDIDDDGDDDLVGIRNDANGIKKIINLDGGLLFEDISNLFVSACDDVKTLFTSDFDNDGDKDFAYVCGDGTMHMALDNGTGYTDSAIGTFDPATLSDGSHTAMFDMNMDGLEDFVFNKTSGGSGFKLATGPGTFQEDYDLFSTDYGRFANVDPGTLPDFVGISSNGLYIQYNILMLPPSFEVTPPTQTYISEGAQEDSIIITFNTIPQEPLEINVLPYGILNAGAGESIGYTFIVDADSTALEPKVIHLSTNEDAIAEDITIGGVTITADEVSWGAFASLLDEHYDFTITDNDLAIFTTNDALEINEGIWSDTVFAHLNVIPQNDVLIQAIADPNYISAFGNDMTETYTIPSGIVGIAPFKMTLLYPEDATYFGDITSSLTIELLSDDAAIDAFTSELLPVTLIENDVVDVQVVFGTTELSEGIESTTMTVSLTSAPTQDVTITYTPDIYLDLGLGTGVPVSITFSGGDVIPSAQTLTVTAVDNFFAEGTHDAMIIESIVSDDIYYAEITPASYIFSISDNDLPQGITVTLPPAATYMEGTTDILMSMSLWTNPNALVTIIGHPDANIDLGLGAGIDNSISFDPLDDATIPRIFNITAVNNTIIGPEITLANISFEIITTDPVLDDEIIEPAEISIQDEDMLQGIQIAAPPAIAYTEGTADLTMSLMLNVEPNSAVTINCIPDAQLDFGAGAGVAVSVLLNDLDATLPHEFSIDIVDDEIIEGFHEGNITFEIITDDPVLTGVTIDPLVISIDDNDFPQSVIISVDGFTHTEGEAGIPFSVALESVPDLDADILLSPSEDIDLGAGFGAIVNLHFENDETAMTPIILTIAVKDNFIVDGDHIGSILAELITDDPFLSDYLIPDITINILDNDAEQGVNITTPGTTFYAEGTTGLSVSLSLFTIPNDIVTISATYDDTQIDLGLIESLTFATEATAMEMQYFNVDIIDDAIVEGDHYALINYIITTDDPQFDGYTIPFTMINISDNDVESGISNATTDNLPTVVVTSGQFQINMPDSYNGKDFAITSINGQIVSKGIIDGNLLHGDLSRMSAGRYMIAIVDGEKMLSIPVILN